MIPQPPPGQGPIDPRDALVPSPSPGSVPPMGQAAPATPPQGVTAPAQPAGMGQQQGGVAQQQSVGGGAGQQQAGGPSPQPGGNPQGSPPWGWVPPGGPPNPRGSAPYTPGGFLPPPRPRRGGIWRPIMLALILLVLVVSLLLNGIFVWYEGRTKPEVLTGVINSGDSRQQIAVIPLEGLIDDAQEVRFERYMRVAQEDTDVKAVIILIDTPGGSVTASDEIYKRIKKFKTERNIPVVVAMRGMATSGGYYAACAADYITAERTTLTGNIGVLMPQYNFHKLMDKYGVEDNTIVAKGAPFKTAGSQTRAPTTQQTAYLQDEIDAAFTIFKDVVKDGRKGKLSSTVKFEDIADGRAFNGDEALKLGLIDEVDATGYLDAAIKHAKASAVPALSNPQVTLYHEPPPSLWNLLTSSYAGGRANAGGGVTINIDASALDRMSSPRMMYLFQGGSGSNTAPGMSAK